MDDRARLFGRVNLIDALVGLFVLALIPLSYGAYLLFRVPVPKVTSIEPSQIVEHTQTTLTITGQDLRPFLHAKLGSVESGGLFVQSPTRAELKVPAELAPGTYDLTIFNEGQELVRKPAAITVVSVQLQPPPQLEIQAVGEFVDLSRDDARLVQVGSKFARESSPFVAQVLAILPARPDVQRVRVGSAVVETPTANKVRVPAIIRLGCVFGNDQCKVGDTAVAENASIMLPVPPAVAGEAGSAGQAATDQIRFQVKEVRSADARVAFPLFTTALALVRVQFLVRPEVAEQVKVGDTDVSSSGSSDAKRATLTEIDAGRETVTASVTIDSAQFPQRMVAFRATVRVPVVLGKDGWGYEGRAVKAGVGFTFDALSYSIAGSILDVKIGPATEVPVR